MYQRPTPLKSTIHVKGAGESNRRTTILKMHWSWEDRHAFTPSTWETGRQISEASLLYRESFRTAMGYTEKSFLKKQTESYQYIYLVKYTHTHTI